MTTNSMEHSLNPQSNDHNTHIEDSCQCTYPLSLPPSLIISLSGHVSNSSQRAWLVDWCDYMKTTGVPMCHAYIVPTTVEPLSKGHFGNIHSFHCREDVLFSEVLKCMITMGIATFGTLRSVLYERLSLSRRALYRRFHCIKHAIT